MASRVAQGVEGEAQGVAVNLPGRNTIRAAGGILLRSTRDGGLEVAVVHRPKYDDWSLPKGKLQHGESFDQAALREVAEETGFRARIDGEAGTVQYRDRRGRPKLVRYFRMRPLDGAFAPGDEVDELRWLDPAVAASTLSYRHDRDLVNRTMAAGR
jgi:8-oxo-dGTP pyrophosphatase MutT (NUDIX family)